LKQTSGKKPESASEPGLDRHKQAALKRGAKRTAAVAERVDQALILLTEELAANAGVYRHNKGRLSKDEVARRAGIKKGTIHSNAQAATSAKVAAWLDGLKSGETEAVERTRRRTPAELLAEVEVKYAALLTNFRKVELEMQDTLAERDEALAQVDELRKAASHAEVGKGNVVAIK
jgi:hypothetical protein